jgi:VCBS repeat-containing protein
MKRILIPGSILVIIIVVGLILIIGKKGNNRPVAESFSLTTEEETPVLVPLTGSDSDGDSLSFHIVGGPSHGSLHGTEPNLIIYTPEKNFNGRDSVSFKADDGRAQSDAAVVTIMVTGVNDPPVAADDTVEVSEDTPVVLIDVLANDTDVDNDRLVVLGVTQGAHGSVTISTNNQLTYTANKNFYGADSFDYTVSDGKGGTDTARVELTIKPVNDAPIISSKPVTTSRVWDSYRYQVKAKDPDTSEPLIYSLTDKPEGMTIDPNSGVIEWRPNSEQVGEHKVVVKVEDANQVPASTTQAFTIKVTSLDSPLVTPMTVKDGYDQRSGKKLSAENKVAVVNASDNKCIDVEAGDSVCFDFSDASIPDGAKIVSASVFIEHFEDKQFPTGKLQWNIGQNWPRDPVIWASMNAPVRDGLENKATDSWDITSIVSTPEKIDDLQLQVVNKSNLAMRKTSLDYVYILVRWY